MYTYLPSHFDMQCQDTVSRLVLENSFATLISVDSAGEVYLSHLPIILEEFGKDWVFSFHFAKKNLHSEVLTSCPKNILVFKGPHSYISPTCYLKKPAVPTWNYAVAHFEGEVTLLDDDQLITHLRKQVDLYEPSLNDSDVMPEEFVDRLSSMIIGFEMTAKQVISKFKLGQNRSPEDQAGILEKLQVSGDSHAIHLAELMK
ncbi:FMN-binding negative transcriptional regulator [Aestuariibacter sp. AA17]|uniref:FMN-binding negative transcriptional regulator n=1 Tax=Fluctibacter corallii TaxID=2984329 RepID=A0ABT3A813_9ALTE|nr:FMN-binding negative transcriptional regulator [Aestuariibacter sp. AA17]MCV2884817.1 FMN-binding negative transcriptional regulator [Aestuariibacter sp. AA17]